MVDGGPPTPSQIIEQTTSTNNSSAKQLLPSSEQQDEYSPFADSMQNNYLDRTGVLDHSQINGKTELRSCMKDSTYNCDADRRSDRFKTEIQWGTTKHKITFADQIERKPLAQVYQVESYKRYNMDDGGDQNPCCTLF